jgi:hypothetical protein
MKTSELTGLTLDWAVATCAAVEIILAQENWGWYSSSWEDGGPIIEREAIQLTPDEYTGTWTAYTTREGEPYEGTGATPLIAAMRCYVASKLGDDIEIPEELK